MPSDIDKLNSMMGGDDGDDDDDDDFKPAPRSIQEYSGIAFFPMPAPDARDRPPADPLQWKTYEERFGTRLYDSPRDEYIQNSFVLNMQTLLYRWAGLGRDEEIYKMFADDDLVLDRIKAQTIKRRRNGLPDLKDPKDVAAETNHQIQLCKKRMDYLEHVLEQNVDITVEQYYSITRGTEYKDALRPLSQQARARVEKDLREWIELYGNLVGRVAKTTASITDLNVSLSANIDEAFKRNNHLTPQGFTIEDLQARAEGKSLPEANLVDGEIIEEEEL